MYDVQRKLFGIRCNASRFNTRKRKAERAFLLYLPGRNTGRVLEWGKTLPVHCVKKRIACERGDSIAVIQSTVDQVKQKRQSTKQLFGISERLLFLFKERRKEK